MRGFQNTPVFDLQMLFNPGLGEAAGAKLKILSGNYFKVYDIGTRSRDYLKLPHLKNCHLQYSIVRETERT